MVALKRLLIETTIAVVSAVVIIGFLELDDHDVVALEGRLDAECVEEADNTGDLLACLVLGGFALVLILPSELGVDACVAVINLFILESVGDEDVLFVLDDSRAVPISGTELRVFIHEVDSQYLLSAGEVLTLAWDHGALS